MPNRKCFSPSEKVKIINYDKKDPYLSSRKLSEKYGCRRTWIQILIKQKEVILTDWKCHESPFLLFLKKRDIISFV